MVSREGDHGNALNTYISVLLACWNKVNPVSIEYILKADYV
jgi:hypothetical protein